MKFSGAVVFAIVLALAAPTASRQAEEQFLLAVLNRDGLAQPFAAFTGKRWKASWPDHSQAELPITLESVDTGWWGIGKAPGRMTLWAPGKRAGEASAVALAQVKTLCSARLGLRTDYKSSALAPPRMKSPYPKDGLLISGSVALGTIDILDRGTADWNRVVAAITSEFNKGESRAIQSFGGWKHPLREEARHRQPIALEALYRAASDKQGWTTYFFEAVRQYPSFDKKDDCGLTTIGQGWLHVGPAAKQELELYSRVTYCDRKGVSVMLPFGTVRAGGRTYWVYQYSGFEDEWYNVVRPEPEDISVAVAFHAGSCPD